MQTKKKRRVHLLVADLKMRGFKEKMRSYTVTNKDALSQAYQNVANKLKSHKTLLPALLSRLYKPNSMIMPSYTIDCCQCCDFDAIMDKKIEEIRNHKMALTMQIKNAPHKWVRNARWSSFSMVKTRNQLLKNEFRESLKYQKIVNNGLKTNFKKEFQSVLNDNKHFLISLNSL